MSPELRRLSGPEVANIMRTFWFEIHSQRGGHAKLRRIIADGEKQTLTIPLHADPDLGTLRAIIPQSSRYVPETELRPHFYTD